MLRLSNAKAKQFLASKIRKNPYKATELQKPLEGEKAVVSEEVLQMFFQFFFFFTEKVLHERGFSKLKASRAKKRSTTTGDMINPTDAKCHGIVANLRTPFIKCSLKGRLKERICAINI